METKQSSDHSVMVAMTDGLEVGGKLRAIHLVDWRSMSAVFPEGMCHAHWTAAGRWIKTAREALDYWRASWLRYGNKNYSPDEVKETVSQLNFSFEELDSATLLAFVPDDAKSDLLTVQHHCLIGELLENEKIDAAGARQWIGIAAAEKLSPSELRDSIERGTITRNQVAAASSNRFQTISLPGLRTMFTRWQVNMERETPISQMTPEIKQQIFEEISPIGELYEWLKGDLKK